MSILPSKIEDFPLLAVIPGGAYQAGSYGIVEAQVVLNNWHSGPSAWGDELLHELTVEAAKAAQWALQYNHLNSDGDWIVASSDAHPKISFRLELMSWDRVAFYKNVTRH